MKKKIGWKICYLYDRRVGYPLDAKLPLHKWKTQDDVQHFTTLLQFFLEMEVENIL